MENDWLNKALLIFSLGVFFGNCTIDSRRTASFNRDCGSHLQKAMNATMAGEAAEELAIAVQYMEAKGMTHGYTSVLYRTDDEDVGRWYQKIVYARDEARKLPPTTWVGDFHASLFEGQRVAIPPGISWFPYNRLQVLICVLAYIACFVWWRRRMHLLRVQIKSQEAPRPDPPQPDSPPNPPSDKK